MSAQEAQQIVNAYRVAMADPSNVSMDLVCARGRIKQALMKSTTPGPDQERCECAGRGYNWPGYGARCARSRIRKSVGEDYPCEDAAQRLRS
jgi:hypothetical protein